MNLLDFLSKPFYRSRWRSSTPEAVWVLVPLAGNPSEGFWQSKDRWASLQGIQQEPDWKPGAPHLTGKRKELPRKLSKPVYSLLCQLPPSLSAFSAFLEAL